MSGGGMFTTLVSVAATFLLLPQAHARSASWIIDHILAGYGGRYLEQGLIAWKVLLALLIFASVRAVLKLAFSAASLALAMRLLNLVRDR